MRPLYECSSVLSKPQTDRRRPAVQPLTAYSAARARCSLGHSHRTESRAVNSVPNVAQHDAVLTALDAACHRACAGSAPVLKSVAAASCSGGLRAPRATRQPRTPPARGCSCVSAAIASHTASHHPPSTSSTSLHLASLRHGLQTPLHLPSGVTSLHHTASPPLSPTLCIRRCL